LGKVEDVKQEIVECLDNENIVQFHQESVRIQSISGNEKEYAEFLYNKMEEFSFNDKEFYEVRPQRPNIWGRIKGIGNGRNLLLVNHTDTVPVEGWQARWEGKIQENPFSGEIVNGELWGRGSVDNKAGMTSSIMAMKALKKIGVKLRGDVIFSAHIDEEGCADDSAAWGIKGLTEAYKSGKIPKADFCVWSDCSDNLHIYYSQLAMVALEINISGKAAYPGTPWLGTSAITKAQRVLNNLEEYSEEMWNKKFNIIQGHPRNVVYSMCGGEPNTFSVPEKCSIRYMMWGIKGDEPRTMFHDVESILRKIAIKEGLEAEIKVLYPGDTGYGYSSAEISEDEPMIKILADNLKKVTEKENMVTGAPYVGESSWIIKDMKVPTVYFGPGKLELCHTLEERIKIEELVQHAKILALSIVDYCI